ncbi:ADP-ribosyltransferase [Bacillus anthracis]|nr:MULTISPECIES: ADP-ribosyltransferase [Bacillus cereus group]MEB9684709.1 ADP-ribosyltransferase [Bacillus anthracis]
MFKFQGWIELLLDKDNKYPNDKVTRVVIKGVKRYIVDATLATN